MTTVREILVRGLQEMGADGLCCPEERCGCPIDELVPCWDCIDVDRCLAARWIEPKSDSSEYDDEFPEGYYRVIA